MLTQLAHDQTLNTGTGYMDSTDLHCTTHIHEGRDKTLEKRWFREGHKVDTVG